MATLRIAEDDRASPELCFLHATGKNFNMTGVMERSVWRFTLPESAKCRRQTRWNLCRCKTVNLFLEKGTVGTDFSWGKEMTSLHTPQKKPTLTIRTELFWLHPFKYLNYVMSACFLAVSLLPLSAHWSAVTPWTATAFAALVLGYAWLQKDLLIVSALLSWIKTAGQDSCGPSYACVGALWGLNSLLGVPKEYRAGTPWIAMVVTSGIWQFDGQKRMILASAYALLFTCAWMASSQSSGRSGVWR